ncbi:LuxR C-terminal-related transcriptional regulator [Streptomyces sp. NPDC058611]|uniref:LuxR C-terminal-related transcriptional regulator n=1 Tax=unclassified Streptomyces TaxID=2593676 RepID=UPI003650A46C
MGALLGGGPGVGKSALMDAALAQAERGGARVVRGEGLAEHLCSATPPQPQRLCTVIGIDDVHLVDQVTFGLVYRLVNSGQALLLATTETGAALPDGVRRLLVGNRIRRLDVDPLDRSGTVRMLTARLGGPVSVDAAARFWELSRGNPLTLRVLADHALAEGTLRPVRGSWQWPGLLGAPDGRLADLVDLLLGDLDPGERELVNMLAVAGPLEAGLPIVTELGDAAESLNRRGVVVARQSGFRLSLRLAHPLCEAVLLESMPELTARRLRRRIADAIEGVGARRRHDAARIGRARLGTGWQPEPERLRETVLSALRGQDHPLAERLCRAALAAGAGDGLAALLGEALAGQRRHVEAEAQYAQAPHSRAVLRPRVLNMALGLGRLAEAEVIAETDGGVRSLVRLFKDRIGEARKLAEGAADAQPLLALLRHESGDSEGALTVLSEAQPGRAGRDDGARLDDCFLRGWITLEARGLNEARVVLDELRERAADGGARQRTYANLLEARILRGAGRTAGAVNLLRQAAVYGGPTDWLTTRSWRIAQLAGAVAESGDTVEAVSLLEEARAAQQDECGYPLMTDAVALEDALVTAHLGDGAAAAHQALEVASRALAAGRGAQALAALHLAARAGAAPKAMTLWEAADGGAPSADAVRMRHVLALADQDGAALDGVSLRFDALGMLPLAAEASAQAVQAHQASGDRRAARAARAASAELISRCDAEPPRWAVPADRRESGTSTELTAREREVVALAVSQLSNQEIADRLVLSVRTVENHLYRAYGKLGVTTRAELAPQLGMGPVWFRRIA